MASSHGSSSHSEAARLEQIITEFFAKSLHIILESRSPFVSSHNYSGDLALSSPSSSTSSSSSVRPRDKWFNLALKECPAALENIDFWRQSNLEPMVVDIILVKRSLGWDPVSGSPRLARNASLKDRFPNYWNSEQLGAGSLGKSEKIVERWVLNYENQKTTDNSSSSRRSSVLQMLYKKSILLLRSLYLTVRLLPAYKIFRDLNSSGQFHTFTLAPRVLSFVEPFTRSEESEMQQFFFTPVDTSLGRLSLSVTYCSSLSDVSSEPSTPITPKFIPDYVGSPIADPIKRFPSLPVTGYGSPSSLFGRPHSWSHDIFKCPPPISLGPYPPGSLVVHNKKSSFDECWPFPTISDFTYLSPPIGIPGSDLPNVLLRSESAPVTLPATKAANSPALTNKQIALPSTPAKGSRLSSSKGERFLGGIQSGPAVEKAFFLSKGESGKFSGLKTSCNSSPRVSINSSPRLSISRSSSRLSFQDDLDESEFACPFVVDDDDATDPGSRPESIDQKRNIGEHNELCGTFPVKKSQHAAVGALVRMLKKAPPLSYSLNLSQPSRDGSCSSIIQNTSRASAEPVAVLGPSASVVSSGLGLPKTAADALEELRGYREMKDVVLSKKH